MVFQEAGTHRAKHGIQRGFPSVAWLEPFQHSLSDGGTLMPSFLPCPLLKGDEPSKGMDSYSVPV